jgi:small subunit ribosomal protein S8
MTDPIADFLIRIKNASLSGNQTVSAPHSKINEALAKILAREGVVEKVEVVETPRKQIVLTLPQKKSKIGKIEVKRISKPGRRVYIRAKEIARKTRGLGLTIISTPTGLMTEKEAQKKRVGGEVVCKVI